MPVRINHRLALALAAATVPGLSTAAFAGESAGAATISVSGSTAMRGFTTGIDFGALTPGATLTINGQTFTANNVSNAKVQLATKGDVAVTPNSPTPTSSAEFLAFRVEYHEQGSVEGVAELANDQIATIPSISGPARNPVNPSGLGVGNRVYINGNAFTTTGTINGFTLGTSGYDTYANYNAAGSNTQGGQNRVQMGISDVRTLQGFSVAGTAAVTRRAGQAGYGKGNPALLSSTDPNNLLGLGNNSVRRQLIDTSALNMTTAKVDPKTGVNYAAGPWNSAGVDNTDNRIVAITATTFAANPGTGLSDLNRTDARWLQTTGRLANGADFNVTTRDINSGTLNVAANNVGIDPSFAVGENDAGNGLGTTNETVIGANIKFSGKTAGGGQLRPTVQNARMAVGHLSISDARGGNAAGSTSNPNQGAAPLRALGFRNTDDNSGAAVKPSFASITDGSYALFQNETYVTIKDPTNGAPAVSAYKALPGNAGLTDAQAWAALTDAQTGIKGDTGGANSAVAPAGSTVTASTGNVSALRNNILNSTGTFPVDSAGIRNPASGLLSNGFIPQKFMMVKKAGDGEAVVSNAGVFDSANFGAVSAAYGGNFDVGNAASVTTGTGATYGSDATANIPINANNYLFGDFNNDGKRDFQDLKYAVTAQNALATQAGVNWKTDASGAANVNNAAAVTGLTITATKGDLIVKGDFNADGNFDGRDLYAIAHGAALADAGKTAAQLANPDNAQLTSASGATTSDQYRGGTLYKNAALDYLQATATSAQKQQATASTANDPSGTNAFNKFDVNRDGSVNRQDAAIVDGFVGKDYRNLNDQLGAVVATDVNAAGTVFKGDPTVDQTTPRRSISLVDAELNDNGLITNALDAGGGSDFKLIRQALGASLLDGDTDFSGVVNFTDLSTLLNNYNLAGKWSTGDSDFSGTVGFTDLSLLLNSYNPSASPSIVLSSLRLDTPAVDLLVADGFNVVVPEPGLATVAAAGFVIGGLRRRRGRPA